MRTHLAFIVTVVGNSIFQRWQLFNSFNNVEIFLLRSKCENTGRNRRAKQANLATWERQRRRRWQCRTIALSFAHLLWRQVLLRHTCSTVRSFTVPYPSPQGFECSCCSTTTGGRSREDVGRSREYAVRILDGYNICMYKAHSENRPSVPHLATNGCSDRRRPWSDHRPMVQQHPERTRKDDDGS
jgi:hypothetical protein